ncbi:efflux RND transporter periplasmic adaptor subunit [Microvirga sp. M2]|uniref:efflux RND transporter periplasmic adaptor subunit n=1 Tax=Microvirga sp. M2 TaxID=3073270 RepID=UPI0039C48319
MRWLTRILVAVAVAAVLGGALYWAFRPKPVLVEIGTVTEGPFRATVEEDGRTRVRDRYVVSAPLAGRLLRLEVKAGDPVEANSRVANLLPSLPQLLDPRTRRELEERVGAAEATIHEADARRERAQAQLLQAQADVRRVRTLQQKGVAAVQQLEREELSLRFAERDLQAAELRKHAAEHELDQARAMLRRYDQPEPGDGWEITAPVSGRVLRVTQESEGVVSAGTPVVEIGDPNDLEVIVDVLTTDAVAIRPGAPVEITRWGGPRDLQGRVRVVEPSAFTKVSALGVEEQRVWVVIDLTSPPEEWATLGDGYRVEAGIIVQEIPKATLVPTSALFRRGDGWAAFVVGDGVARERQVSVAHRSSRMAAVSSGLRPDERVVLYPPTALSNEASVRER